MIDRKGPTDLFLESYLLELKMQLQDTLLSEPG